MARHKASKFASRKMNENELLKMFDQSLELLSQMAKIYDAGTHQVALSMATEVHKILTDGGAAIRLRGSKTFTTIDFGDETRMINAMHKLAGVILDKDQTKIDFVADFQMGDESTVTLPFRDWWNKDIIYRASAAIPGGHPGMLPLNGTPFVPFQERETINRRDFVALLRNTRGAHQDGDMPLLLDELEQTYSWGQFIVQTPNGIKSTEDGTLKVGATIMTAMMRQIVHELLIAYGCEDSKDASLLS